MNNTTYYQRSKYRNLCEEEKIQKREYGKNRYHMSEERKQKLKEYQKKYQKNCREAKKV